MVDSSKCSCNEIDPLTASGWPVSSQLNDTPSESDNFLTANMSLGVAPDVHESITEGETPAMAAAFRKEILRSQSIDFNLWPHSFLLFRRCTPTAFSLITLAHWHNTNPIVFTELSRNEPKSLITNTVLYLEQLAKKGRDAHHGVTHA